MGVEKSVKSRSILSLPFPGQDIGGAARLAWEVVALGVVLLKRPPFATGACRIERFPIQSGGYYRRRWPSGFDRSTVTGDLRHSFSHL